MNFLRKPKKKPPKAGKLGRVVIVAGGGGRAGVITADGHRDVGDVYEGTDADELVACGRARWHDDPVPVPVDDDE